MKYIYLVGVIFLVGCGVKMPMVDNVVEKETKVEVVEVANVVEPKVIPNEETVLEEQKIIKKIDVDVPTSCVMWSDGCNVCTHVGDGKASCTDGPECINKMVSCLQWH
jgi:hypothetical protein